MYVTINKDGKDIECVVKKPGNAILTKAQLYASRKLKEAIADGAMSRNQMTEYMKEIGEWSNEDESKLKDLLKKLEDGARQLSRGAITAKGKKFTKEQARNLAIDMRVWRVEYIMLLSKLRARDDMTTEGFAENAKFDYLVANSCFYKDGSLVFNSIEDYNNKAEEDYASNLASTLSKLIYGLDDLDKQYPENKFLIKYNFVDDKLRLINKDNKLIDKDGRLVDDKGRYIDSEGNFIDRDGNPVDEFGNPRENFVEFEE